MSKNTNPPAEQKAPEALDLSKLDLSALEAELSKRKEEQAKQDFGPLIAEAEKLGHKPQVIASPNGASPALRVDL